MHDCGTVTAQAAAIMQPGELFPVSTFDPLELPLVMTGAFGVGVLVGVGVLLGVGVGVCVGVLVAVGVCVAVGVIVGVDEIVGVDVCVGVLVVVGVMVGVGVIVRVGVIVAVNTTQLGLTQTAFGTVVLGQLVVMSKQPTLTPPLMIWQQL